jgi:hypothetical protein
LGVHRIRIGAWDIQTEHYPSPIVNSASGKFQFDFVFMLFERNFMIVIMKQDLDLKQPCGNYDGSQEYEDN